MSVARCSVVALVLLVGLAACKESSTPAASKARASKPAPAARAASAKEAKPARGQHPAGSLPFDFPAVATTARAGDFVLAVPSKWIREARQKGAVNQSFLYYGGWMVQPGPKESKVRDRSGDVDTIPNSVIIPIRRGETARPGDIVLTAWASGFGMQRAVVLRGKSRKRPSVRYLDMKYENPAGLAKEADTLEPNTFHKLRGEWEPGAGVAIRAGERGFRHGIVVALHEQKVLTIGFGRKMAVVNRSDCVLLPHRPRLKRGDDVSVPYLGRFHPGTVKRVSARIGRVFVTFQPEGTERTLGVGFGNVIGRLQVPGDVKPDAGVGDVGVRKEKAP